MDKFVELSREEARFLLAGLQKVAEGNYGIYKIRVYYGSDGVKFKVNEGIWSPPLGKVVVTQ